MRVQDVRDLQVRPRRENRRGGLRRGRGRQQRERARHLTDRPQGNAGIESSAVKLSVPEQDLDDPDVADLRSAMAEARRFLGLPRPERQERQERRDRLAPAPRHSAERARRLFRFGQPSRRTPAAVYLARRGLIGISAPVLRYHPACFYKGSDDALPATWPALLAAISDDLCATTARGGCHVTINSWQPCCTRDEGRPLGLGLQDQGPNHRKLRRSNGRGGERCGKRREQSRQAPACQTNVSELSLTCRKLRDAAKTRLQLFACHRAR